MPRPEIHKEIPELTDAIVKRFIAKVQIDAPDDCWLWTASLKPNSGYGQFGIKGHGVLYAHRIMYKLHYGVDPGDKQVCHTCDNRQCCNPAHLWLGTGSENMQDAVAKGRLTVKRALGESNGAAKLNAAKVREIRRLRPEKTSTELAAMFGITRSTMCSLLRGETWAHVK